MSEMLITGGAGFIGANAAVYFAGRGWRVTILDSLVRPGANANLEWLQSIVSVRFIKADIRDAVAVDNVIRELKPSVILHLAAQVAVTRSIEEPAEDFAVNACGTINLLEAVRRFSSDTLVIYASTNKVYGDMHQQQIQLVDGKYMLSSFADGVDELQPTDFCSPYGCSKGTADRYLSEYSRTYGLATVIFRQSCIYGPRQFGCNDQGWVAWFIIAAILGRPITLFGDGRQSRDILWVDDLVGAYEAAIDNREQSAGKIFNIGGGKNNIISLLELLERLNKLSGKPIEYGRGEWRLADQFAYCSNLAKADLLLGWRPKTSMDEGIERLYRWVLENIHLHQESGR
jgi:CDP-paratose 2-epimerase